MFRFHIPKGGFNIIIKVYWYIKYVVSELYVLLVHKHANFIIYYEVISQIIKLINLVL